MLLEIFDFCFKNKQVLSSKTCICVENIITSSSRRTCLLLTVKWFLCLTDLAIYYPEKFSMNWAFFETVKTETLFIRQTNKAQYKALWRLQPLLCTFGFGWQLSNYNLQVSCTHTMASSFEMWWILPRCGDKVNICAISSY